MLLFFVSESLCFSMCLFWNMLGSSVVFFTVSSEVLRSHCTLTKSKLTFPVGMLCSLTVGANWDGTQKHHSKKTNQTKNKTVTDNDYCGRKRPHLPQICPSWVSRTRLCHPAVHWASVLEISWNVGKIYVNKSSAYFREITPVGSESKSAVPLCGVFSPHHFT